MNKKERKDLDLQFPVGVAPYAKHDRRDSTDATGFLIRDDAFNPEEDHFEMLGNGWGVLATKPQELYVILCYARERMLERLAAKQTTNPNKVLDAIAESTANAIQTLENQLNLQTEADVDYETNFKPKGEGDE